MDSLESLAASGHAGVRVAAAESLTSGLLCARIGAGEDASGWFAGGIVAYFTQIKECVLGLRPGVDPCSAECAVQLAIGVRRLFQVDVAVSTTGVGGPDPEGGHRPGTVHLGWAWPEGNGSEYVVLEGGPEDVLHATVEQALDLLARQAARLADGHRAGDRG